MSKKYFFRGTLLLTAAGILSRILGFFYRIFLSHTVGAEGIGLYQLVLPLQSLGAVSDSSQESRQPSLALFLLCLLWENIRKPGDVF